MDTDTIEALKETIAKMESDNARLDALIAQSERPTPSYKEAQVADEPVTAASRLAAADEAFTRLVSDPGSSQAQRERALVLKQRAEREFENEQTRIANFGRMARSMALRADENAARDAAERAAAKAKDEFEEREKLTKWGPSMRDHYIRTGGR